MRGPPLNPLATPLTTQRLTLIPSTAAHLTAELAGNEQFASEIGATVPSSWPPGEYDRPAQEFFLARLNAVGPTAVGWFGWYAVRMAPVGSQRTVIGGAGYFGPPDESGVVEIGYSICPEWRNQGYATEMVRALAAHAARQPVVQRIIAHTSAANGASVSVLTRSGFECVGPGADGDLLRFAWQGKGGRGNALEPR